MPFDDEAGFTEQNHTPAVNRLTALTGAIADSFEKGSELLSETAGINLSESTVRRTTESVGNRIQDAFSEGKTFGSAPPWEWFTDALNQRIAYVEIDATGVPMQGIKGAKAEGRMAYVGAILNPLPDPERVFENLPEPGDRMLARYVSGIYSLAQMGPLLRQQAAQVGMDQAEVWIGLTDGGSGLDAFIQSNFPRVDAVILDFWHACEYLSKLAKAMYPNNEEEAQSLGERWSRILKEEGGTTMLSVLREWEYPPGVSGLNAVREEVLRFFGNQESRMDYPRYEANGWYIGSGAIESACKTVVGRRLKGAGMRWSEKGGNEVCHVRALYRSEKGQWQAFWRQNVAA